ncbi:MAG: RsmF rRNA methyltransferase first C-terminal domain-containing protein [Defluviitaleaceae bacterium]|nr:RsmF rRNA methyltransferase first C-terminal domain-containing protein [Defluviitaleaceae bacterium]
MILPEAFTEKMRSLLGAEAEAFFDALAFETKASGLRCNILKTNPEEMAKLLDIPLTAVPWCGTGFTYPSDVHNRPSKNPLYQAGLYYLQEPSAMAPVVVLDPQPGDRVLDLCAAPGGKAVQIAGQLQGKGVLVANDTSATRSKALVKNLTLCGAKNAIVTTEQPQRLASRFEEYFDKILIDAPCSGEGMFRKDLDAIKGWTANKPEVCVAMQREILRYAAAMVKPGGRMVYSTCTFDPRENEGSIAEFLSCHPDFQLVTVRHQLLGFAKGRPDWVGGPECISGAARLWPHLLNGEGHFLCVLEKKATSENKVSANTMGRLSSSSTALGLFKEFCEDNLVADVDVCPANSTIIANKSKRSSFDKSPVFAVPNDLPDLAGLRIARSGWYLGDIKKDRFEPSHALALGLTVGEARFVHHFPSPDDADCARYLRGETIDVASDFVTAAKAEKPWVLICVADFPLGWARLVNGRLKNKNPYTLL